MVPRAAGLVLVMLSALACGNQTSGPQGAGGAQAAARSSYSPLTYPLDEAKVRKVAAVVRAWNPRGPAPKSENPAELAAYMSKANAGADFVNAVGRELVQHGSTARLEGVADVKAAIANAGLTPREFAEALLAYTNAMGALDMENLDALSGEASSSPSGVFKDNVELLRRMNKEEPLPNW